MLSSAVEEVMLLTFATTPTACLLDLTLYVSLSVISSDSTRVRRTHWCMKDMLEWNPDG